MCAVSMIHDWAQALPMQSWNPITYQHYLDLIRRIEELDRKVGQPDCEDPAKAAFLKSIGDRLSNLEKKVEE